MQRMYCKNASLVLAHGPWFDACLWHSMILPLQKEGLRIVAAALPFTSFEEDRMALIRAINRAPGPVVLVGHSYTGAIVSGGAAMSEKVVGCVYLSALAPEGGETIRQALNRDSPKESVFFDSPDDAGYLWATQEHYRMALAPDCMPHQRSILHATQRPIAQACLDAPIPDAAVQRVPSWFLISERDRVVSPSMQLRSAQRMSAQISSRPVDHAAPITDPDSVIETILDAARGALAIPSSEF
jgi:pimeloyl-ACP methyl ester carboxylesterase